MSLPVTVIIPTHNRAALLREALGSVRGQTLPPEAVIVVDDGSTEDIRSVAEGYGALYLRQAHAGASTARNFGLEAARTRWIALLDSDDVWEADKTERQFGALAQHEDAVAAFSDYEIFSGEEIIYQSALYRTNESLNENHITDVRNAYELAKGGKRRDAVTVCEGDALAAGISHYNFMLTSSLVFRRDIALAIGKFDPSLRICEDWEFLMRFVRRCGSHAKALCIERPLVRYRRHDGNLSSSFPAAVLALSRMVDGIHAHPDRYPAPAEAYWGKRIHEFAKAAAIDAARAGDFETSRELFGYTLRQNHRAWLFAAGFFCSVLLDNVFGQAVYRMMRRLHDLF